MLTAKAPPSRNSVSTSRRQTSDRPLTGVRQRFDRYLTSLDKPSVRLSKFQWKWWSKAHKGGLPRTPPMWGRTSTRRRAPNVIISRESEPSLARLSPAYPSSRVTRQLKIRTACVIPLGDGEDVFR